MADTRDYSAERLVRCIPVAKQVLKLIAEADLPIGNITPEQSDEGYKEIAEKVLVALLAANVNWTDRQFIFQMVMQAVELTNDKVIANLEFSFNSAMDKLWKKDINDLTMNDIDKVLQEKEIGTA